MSSIGPELPPHLLAKRKRQAEQEPPAHPQSASQNNSPTSEKRQRTAGPSPPPSHAQEANSSSPKRIQGPTRPPAPPAPLAQKPTTTSHKASSAASDSDSDDDYGPSLPTTNTPHNAPEPSQSPSSDLPEAAAPSKSSQRPDWMTAPPPSSLSNLDPSRQRARGFNTSKAAKPSGGIAPQWTETPEEKRQRLANEVLGVVPEAARGAELAGAERERQRRSVEEDTRRRVREVEERRGASLLSLHQGGKKTQEDDDPSKRGFDWEKDMNSGTKISGRQREELVKGAKGFGGRFAGGGFL